MSVFGFKCLQIGNADLVGNKFNGHNLSIYLQEYNIESKHLVSKKLSKAQNTYVLRVKKAENYTDAIIKDRLFLEADIVHLHLIHCTEFNINYLPILTRLKPTVITLHEPFFTTGHCLYAFNCDKWKKFCFDCPNLDIPLKTGLDYSSYDFLTKKLAIQNSNISAIVASDYMENIVNKSPIWYGKKIYKLPFGINQDVFKPASNKALAKKRLRIDEDSIVLMFRATKNEFKGLDYIKRALHGLKTDKKIVILAVEKKGLLKEFKHKFKIKEYGWIYDDEKLAELYRAADLFLMPSKQEAFGMMSIEAMSSGVPVVSIKGTSLENITNSPECGFSVEPEQFCETLQKLINNPALIKEKARLSLDYARQHYGKKSYVKGMVEIYKDVIRNHSQTEEAKLTLEQLKKYAPKNTRTINSTRKRDFIYSRKNIGNQAVTTIFGIKFKTKIKDKGAG